MTAAPRTDVATLMRADFAALARKDLAGMQALWHPDVEAHVLSLGRVLDHDGASAVFAELFAALDPFGFEVVRINADGDTSIGEWRMTGTVRGALGGMVPTGRDIELCGVDVMEWEDGLLRRVTVYFDGATVARQLGLLPAQGSWVERGATAAISTIHRLRARFGRV